ncbi:hypothetical protein CRN52_13325 [Vibrio vulnificus]|uniref:Uncharacterized protein n=1 Tax=Vibrio vulnificus TaxID=672 RepID=A0A2S3R1S7_VIBVL|nr:hypothetical protein CRN52_13325 [Vibrio vulnificus]
MTSSDSFNNDEISYESIGDRQPSAFISSVAKILIILYTQQLKSSTLCLMQRQTKINKDSPLNAFTIMRLHFLCFIHSSQIDIQTINLQNEPDFP